MTLMLLFSGLGLMAVPAWARPLSRRLPPAEWARICACLLAAGAAVIEASLLIQAAPTALRALGLEGIADYCEHALGAVTPGGAPVGVTAAAGAVAIAVCTGRAVLKVRRTQRSTWVEQEIGWHGILGGYHLVVLPSPKPVAFSNGSRFGQVVVTRGLITALSDDQLTAVLCHELAHLRHRHQRYLLVASTVGTVLGWLPLVGQGVAALRCALERWADEEAAGPAPGGRANVRAALLRVAELASLPEVAAFTPPGTVAERLEALQADPTSGRAFGPRTLVYLPAGMLLVAAVVALDSILAHVTFLHTLAGLCPPH